MQIPVLETERLTLREPRESDLDREELFYSSPQADFVGGKKNRMECWATIVNRIGHWAIRGYGFWHCDDRATGRYVGRIGLLMPYGWPEPEIGWSLMPDSTGRGYATEAAFAARDHAYKTLGWTTAISLIDPANAASRAVAERMGATYDRPFTHEFFGAMHIWRHPAPEALA